MQSFHTGSMAQGSVGEGTESVRWLEGLLVGGWFGANGLGESLARESARGDAPEKCLRGGPGLGDALRNCWPKGLTWADGSRSC